MESKLWTEEAVVNLELVTVWSPGREGEEESQVLAQREGDQGGDGGGRILVIRSAPEECYHQPSACSLKFITI